MKKQILFLCAIIVALSGLTTPISGVTSARYKELWKQQLAKRSAVASNNGQDLTSVDLKNVANSSNLMQLTGLSKAELRTNEGKETAYNAVNDLIVRVNNSVEDNSIPLADVAAQLREAVQYVQVYGEFYGMRAEGYIRLKETLNDIQTTVADISLDYINGIVPQIKHALDNKNIKSADDTIAVLEQEVKPLLDEVQSNSMSALAELTGFAKMSAVRNNAIDTAKLKTARTQVTELYTYLLDTLNTFKEVTQASAQPENVLFAYMACFEVTQKLVQQIGKPFHLIMHARNASVYRGDKVIDNELSAHTDSLRNIKTIKRTTAPVDQQELIQDNQKKKKSFLQKYASKIAATLAGAAIVGAYEWFAESNPGTVPAIGLKSIFNSLLSLFGLGAQQENVVQQPVENNNVTENVVKDDAPEVPTTSTTSTTSVTNQPVEQPVIITIPVKEQSTTSTTSTTPVITQLVEQQPVIITIPVKEQSTTSTTSTTPVIIQPVKQPVKPIIIDPIIKNTSTTSTASFTTQPIEQAVVIVEDKKLQDTVSSKSDSFGTISFSNDEDDSFESVSWSGDEDSEDEIVVLNKSESKAEIKYPESKEEIKLAVKQPTVAKALADKPELNGAMQVVNSALDKLLAYANNTGNWFLNLFDTKNNISYNQHVDTFGALIEQMEKDVNYAAVDNNSMLQATKDFASSLVRQLKDTHTTLNGHKVSKWSITPTSIKAMALGFALKSHVNDKIKTERNTALQNLRKQFNGYPGLEAKINELQETMSGFGDEIEQKDQNTLLAGLTHRLKL